MNATKSNALDGFKEDWSQGATYRYQDSLPHLPVPTLEETAARYLRSVKAVASPEQYATTEKAVKEFIRPGGDGERLQKRLISRANDPKIKNWLYDWWNEAAYMAYRDPVVPYVSYFYSYKDDRLRKNPATRAAAIVTAALDFKTQLDAKTLEPEYMRKMPIDMELYRFMFHCSRIPKPNVDDAIIYPVDGNEYIIVIRKNRFFKVPYKTNGRQLSTSELELQFLQIYDLTANAPAGPAIGALTSENRDKWVQFREDLLAAGNRAALETIEKSAFVVCLDEGNPITNEERAHQYWHGDGQNRFYDKPLQFIVCDSGAAGFMGEHSMMDGTQTHRINDYVCDVIVNNKVKFGTEKEYKGAPEEVKFSLNSNVESDISTAVNDFANEINKHELSVFAFHGYGKNLIKKFKCSPDAYVQMLLQLAYYKANGVNRPTYESAATRAFAQGRTETCRSVSLESVDFCKTMENPNATNAEKVTAGRKALDAHVKYISDASNGKGVDRHLFGLKKLLNPGEPVPALFQDPMYSYSCSWYLSTSQLSSEFFNGYGWSQVIDDGFGLAYMINSNSIQVNIVSKKLGSERMKHYLTEAALDMAAVFQEDVAAKAKL
jgi:carnitine O-acetyltransferase